MTVVLRSARGFWEDAASQLAVLLLLTAAAFSPVVRNGFVNHDDPEYVYENTHVRSGLSVQNAWWAFRSLNANVSYWHPVTWISHQMDCQIFGLRPGPHHLTSLWIHMANTALVLALLRQLRLHPKLAFFVAGLFAVHPLHVESVAWIAERKDLLYALFWLASLVAYVQFHRSQENRWYWLSLLFFILATMSKPTAASLPAVLLLVEVLPILSVTEDGNRHELWPGWRRASGVVTQLLPFVFVSLVCATVTWAAQAQLGAVPTLASVPVSQRLDNAFVAYERYVLKTFIPVDLCASYVRSTAWPLWQVAGAIALCTALTWWTWRARRKNLWLLFGWCWFVLTLLPNIGLIQAGPQSMADRYTYLPLVGIFLMAAGAIGGERREMRCSWAVNLLGFAALALCSALSFQQVKYWKDGVALFGRAVAIDNSNWVAQLGLGMALTQERRFDEALGHLHRALALPGNAAEAERRLGICYGYKGEPEVAIGHFRESLKLNSGSAETHLLLARLLTAPGRTDAEAQEGAELVGRGLALRREISSEDWMSAAAVYQRAEWWKEADIAARRAGRAGG